MYYSYPCSYCGRVFFTWSNHKSAAAQVLYEGIKAHLVDYNEDHKEFEFDETPSIEVDQMYAAMVEYEDKPAGGYELR